MHVHVHVPYISRWGFPNVKLHALGNYDIPLIQIEASPYHYDSHVQLIQLLRQLGDLDKARQARRNMNKVFPLSEGEHNCTYMYIKLRCEFSRLLHVSILFYRWCYLYRILILGDIHMYITKTFDPSCMHAWDTCAHVYICSEDVVLMLHVNVLCRLASELVRACALFPQSYGCSGLVMSCLCAASQRLPWRWESFLKQPSRTISVSMTAIFLLIIWHNNYYYGQAAPNF